MGSRRLGEVWFAAGAAFVWAVAGCGTDDAADGSVSTTVVDGGSAGAAGADSGAGGTSGNIGSVCEQVCSKMAAARCSAEPNAAQCAVDCTADMSYLETKCAVGVVEAYLTCAASTGAFHCNAVGEAELSGCDGPQRAIEECSVCAPAQDGEDACDACLKQSCCAALQDSQLDPDVVAYSACLDGCSGAGGSCAEGCRNQYPRALEIRKALNDCMASACTRPCINEP